jgi:hypothetical protein
MEINSKMENMILFKSCDFGGQIMCSSPAIKSHAILFLTTISYSPISYNHFLQLNIL